MANTEEMEIMTNEVIEEPETPSEDAGLDLETIDLDSDNECDASDTLKDVAIVGGVTLIGAAVVYGATKAAKKIWHSNPIKKIRKRAADKLTKGLDEEGNNVPNEPESEEEIPEVEEN